MDRRTFVGMMSVAALAGHGRAAARQLGPPRRSSVDAAPRIGAALAAGGRVALGPGEYGLQTTLVIPPGCVLTGAADGSTVLRLVATGANASRAVVQLGAGAVAADLVLDGGLQEREASGELRDYVFGCVVIDASNATVDRCRSINSGATAASFTKAGGNGGGFLIWLTPQARSSVTGNRIRGCTSDNPDAGFHARILTPFREPLAPDGLFAERNLIENLRGFGGNKNAIELCGPATQRNTVRLASIENPRGQGAIEADFGASFNDFDQCSVVFREFTLKRSLDCFSQRTGPRPPLPPAVSQGNRFTDCRVSGSVQNASFYLRAFVESGASARASFVRPVCDLQVSDAPDRTPHVYGFYQEATMSDFTGTVVEQPSFSGVDVGVVLAGDRRTDGLQVQDGEIHARGALYEATGRGRRDVLFANMSLEARKDLRSNMQPLAAGGPGGGPRFVNCREAPQP